MAVLQNINNIVFISNNFDEEINEDQNEILKKTKKVVVRKKFNKSLDFLKEYTNIEVLTCFNYIFSINIFPSNLIRLELLGNFNNPLNNLPSTLKELILGELFNQSLDNLPNIEFLIVGRNFNKAIDYLPQSIKYLGLGEKFNQPLNNLPEGLNEISIGFEFGSNFSHSIDNFPDSIRIITLFGVYNKKITKFPKNLEEIHFYGYYSKKLPKTNAKIFFENYDDSDDSEISS